MAGRRARSLVYDDVRDAGQSLPAIDQFTDFVAVAGAFLPLDSAVAAATGVVNVNQRPVRESRPVDQLPEFAEQPPAREVPSANLRPPTVPVGVAPLPEMPQEQPVAMPEFRQPTSVQEPNEPVHRFATETAPPLPEAAPTARPSSPPPELPHPELPPSDNFTFDEINDIFVRHGAPEMPEFAKVQQRPIRGTTPDDPLGYKRYADEKHDEQLGHMGVLDSMLKAQEDIGRQGNEYNDLMLRYLERLGKDNNNDARRLRELNSKLQRDRTSLTDVNI